MLKRLWLVISILWAILCIGGGFNLDSGPTRLNFLLAALPFILGRLVCVVFRFVVHGTDH